MLSQSDIFGALKGQNAQNDHLCTVILQQWSGLNLSTLPIKGRILDVRALTTHFFRQVGDFF